MKSYHIFSAIVLCFWLSIIYIVIVSSIPFNPMSPSKSTILRVKLLLPEAWNFFTRDPREDKIYIYEINKDGEPSLLNRWPNNSINNFFGINRTARAIGTDYGMILLKVSDSLWQETNETQFKQNILIKKKFIPQFSLKYEDDINENKHFLYGQLLFVKKQIKPWAWFSLNLETDAQLKYIYGFIEKNK